MALTASALTDAVFADAVAQNAGAADAVRENAEMGIAAHNPVYELYSAICTGFVNALLTIQLTDSYTGKSGSGGTCDSVHFSFPSWAIDSASAKFLSDQEFTGESAPMWADLIIGSVCRNAGEVGYLEFNNVSSVGSGTGEIMSDPDRESVMQQKVESEIITALKASGKFTKEDKGAENPTSELAEIITYLAAAYGYVVGNIQATTIYSGTEDESPDDVSGENTGSIK